MTSSEPAPGRRRSRGSAGPARRLARSASLLLTAAAVACASGGSGPRAGASGAASDGVAAPAPVPDSLGEGDGIRVVYPPSATLVTAFDSTFIFGSVRPANARVTVNGTPARQAASGGWLAYVPVRPGDFVFHLEAAPPEEGRPVARRDWPVRVAGALQASWAAMVDTSSVTPRDSLLVEPGDTVSVRFRGVAGLRGRIVLGDGLASAAFREVRGGEGSTGRQVFGAAKGATGSSATFQAGAWYRSDLEVPDAVPRPRVRIESYVRSREDLRRGTRRSAAADIAPERGERATWVWGGSAGLAIEVAGPDSTLRLDLPARVELRDPSTVTVAVLDDDPALGGRTDGTVVARTAPDGVYFLFLPNGAHALTGRRVGGLVELRLDRDLSVWASPEDVHPLPAGAPAPISRVPVVRTRRLGYWTRILVPLDEPLPVQVRQQTNPARYQVTIFGARAATEFMRYDFGDPLVRELLWNQPSDSRFVLDVELDQAQPWGFRYGYQGSDFYLDVRQAPELKGGLFRSILDGLRIVVDPGHAPDPGSTGPTGFMEKDANLAVALELARILRDDGAEAILTRDASTPSDSLPGLNDRTNLAAREEADLLVSVHHNALPDGVNPFENNGSSTYYYHPQSLPLARAIQRELLNELGLPDFGVAHGNLAVVRTTAMPAVLTEAAFMMIPEQEELLRTEAFREREARAIARGIERFLKEAR